MEYFLIQSYFTSLPYFCQYEGFSVGCPYGIFIRYIACVAGKISILKACDGACLIQNIFLLFL